MTRIIATIICDYYLLEIGVFGIRSLSVPLPRAARRGRFCMVLKNDQSSEGENS